MPRKLTRGERRRIDEALEHFARNQYLFETFAKSLMTCFAEHPLLAGFIHFIKYRIKDKESLRAKLEKRILSEDTEALNERIDASNLFDKVTDLAGLRIIHLHTEQLRQIHPLILEILQEQQCETASKPMAYCWDVEYQKLFQGIGIETTQRDSMYTTVHYDIAANQRTRITCELQVRTLMDEVWGEVSHQVNYPTESPSVACQDQLKVLARLTSGCGRLVDSIFKTHHEANPQGLTSSER